jgi:L-ascorbate metabolism protein UlaG (beta-lactamase superfamily)
VQVGKGVRITFVPSQHFSARGMCDRNTSLWGGYVIGSSRHKVYFAGDTGFGPHFKQVRNRFGPVSLALLPIGAFRPRWFMAPVHLSPAEAVKAHRILEAHHSLAIHYGTFPLGDDGQDEPVNELRKAMKKAGVSGDRFWVLGFGRGRMVPDATARATATQKTAEAPRP